MKPKESVRGEEKIRKQTIPAKIAAPGVSLTIIMIDDHYSLSLLEFFFGILFSPEPIGTQTR
jgi:hypothetical protein